MGMRKGKNCHCVGEIVRSEARQDEEGKLERPCICLSYLSADGRVGAIVGPFVEESEAWWWLDYSSYHSRGCY